MVTKGSRKLKQPCSWELEVCLSMCNFFVNTSHYRVNVWWSWSTWKFFLGLKTKWLLGPHILWILNNSRFNKWFKGKKYGKISNFCQISKNRVFWVSLKYLVKEFVMPQKNTIFFMKNKSLFKADIPLTMLLPN